MGLANRWRRLVGAIFGMAVLAAGVVLPSAAKPSAASSPQLFPNSPFDKSVVSQPIATESSALVTDLVTQIKTTQGSPGVHAGTSAQTAGGGMPIFTVPSDQPMVPLSVQSGCGDFRGDGTKGSTGPSAPIPSGAYTTSDPNYTGDSAMVVYQPSSDTEWELWQAAPASSGWSACWGGALKPPPSGSGGPSTSDGVFPSPYGSSASGISHLATTITEQDVSSGQIDHTIAVQLVNCDGHIAPADRNDGSGCSTPGEPPEGTWFRMPSSVQMPGGMTPFAQMVFRALQTYGMVAVDKAGSVMFQAESSQDSGVAWPMDPIGQSFGTDSNGNTTAEWAVLNGIPWGDLQVICAPGTPSPCVN